MKANDRVSVGKDKCSITEMITFLLPKFNSSKAHFQKRMPVFSIAKGPGVSGAFAYLKLSCRT
ncbi:MAG: hypothetical protein FWF59_08190, partial [Turicibacter sp.]|nr:hypothetical protein [Turicibacter sp.]